MCLNLHGYVNKKIQRNTIRMAKYATYGYRSSLLYGEFFKRHG